MDALKQLFDGKKTNLGLIGLAATAMLVYAQAKGWLVIGDAEKQLLASLMGLLTAGGYVDKLRKQTDALKALKDGA